MVDRYGVAVLVQRDDDDRSRSGVEFIAGPDHSLEHHIEWSGDTA